MTFAGNVNILSVIYLGLFLAPICGFSFIPSDTVIAADHLSLANNYLRIEEFDSASVRFRKAIAYSHGVPSWSGTIGSHLGFSYCFYNLQELDSLEKYLLLTEKIILADKPDVVNLSVLYNLFGGLYHLKGDLEKWLENSQKGLALNGISRHMQFTFYQQAAEAYRTKGDFDQSVKYANYALNMPGLQTFVYPGEILDMKNTLAGAYYQLGEYASAIAVFEENLQLLNVMQPEQMAGFYIGTYNGLATAYIGSGKYPEALLQLQKAQNIHRFSSWSQEETWHNLGILYLEKKQLDSARHYLRLAVNKNLENKHFDFANVAREYRWLGNISDASDSAETALRYYQKAIGLLTETGFQSDWSINPSLENIKSETELLSVCWAKGRLLQKLAIASPSQHEQYLRAAFDTYAFCLALIDRMRKSYHDDSKKFWNEQIHPIFENAVLVAARLYKLTEREEYLNAAFRFAEKSKTAILAEAVRASLAKQAGGIPQYLLTGEKELKMNIAAYRRKIFVEEQLGKMGDIKKIQFWTRKIFEFERLYENLRNQMEVNYPEYFRLKYDTHVTDIASIRRSLRRDAQWVSYVLSDQEMIIFSITRNHAKVEVISLPENFNKKFTDYIYLLRNIRAVVDHGLEPDFFYDFANQSYQLFELALQPCRGEV
ncbi:MAG: tetratricopeptide repeat protein [Bacteroidia bacterium]